MVGKRKGSWLHYHTLHLSAGFMWLPTGQRYSRAKSSELESVPITRNRPGLWTAVLSLFRVASGRIAPHQIWAKLRKNSCVLRLEGENARVGLRREPLGVGKERLLDAAVVGDVLALRSLAIELHADLVDRVAAVLLHQAGGPLVERLDRAIAPPAVQVAVAVEQSTLVVEAVGQLVPDHHPDATVVDRAREVTMVERWLQDAGRKHDLVLVAAVVSVHHGRCRVPGGFVHHLAELLLVRAPDVAEHGERVLEVALRVYGQRGVARVQDEVGVADPERHRVDLLLGEPLGRRVDPLGLGEDLAERLLQLVRHPRWVLLAPEQRVREALLRAEEPIVQVVDPVAHEPPQQVVGDDARLRLADQLHQILHVAHREHHHEVGRVHRPLGHDRQVARPVDLRHLIVQVLQDQLPLHLELDHLVGGTPGRIGRHTQQLDHLHHELPVRVQVLTVGGLQVVLARRQPQRGLVELHDIFVRVLYVRPDPLDDQHVVVVATDVRRQVEPVEAGIVPGRVEQWPPAKTIQKRPERLQSSLLDQLPLEPVTIEDVATQRRFLRERTDLTTATQPNRADDLKARQQQKQQSDRQHRGRDDEQDLHEPVAGAPVQPAGPLVDSEPAAGASSGAGCAGCWKLRLLPLIVFTRRHFTHRLHRQASGVPVAPHPTRRRRR
uniref:Uncharacterized protein n=1 Tax=Anopheles atroparvus TaxID=41427 RepID=A0A182J3U6_ANOAO